jgi:hypothetical protein
VISFAAVAEADTSGQTNVALAALGLALVTTLATLGVQLWTHHSSQRQTRSKERYEELTKAYTAAGETMAAATQSVLSIMTSVSMGRDHSTEDIFAPFGSVTDRYRHVKNMLVLHGASPALIATVAEWQACIEAYVTIPGWREALPDAGVIRERETARLEFEEALTAFYAAAGKDARSRSGLAD